MPTTFPRHYTARLLINVARDGVELERAEHYIRDLPSDTPTLDELLWLVEAKREDFKKRGIIP